jgi:membrane carboxypeptidase/penicillin-binding protein PbpC
VVDREGRLLRPYPTVEGRWRLPASTGDVDPRFFDLLFAYEDKRFRSHFGVDPLALARAAPTCNDGSKTWRASAPARSETKLRSPSWRSTTQAARC